MQINAGFPIRINAVSVQTGKVLQRNVSKKRDNRYAVLLAAAKTDRRILPPKTNR